jgi:cell division protein FtsN
VSQPQEPVTFYNTLTNSNVAYAPLSPAPTPASSGSVGSVKGATAPVASGATAARETTSGAAESTKAAAVSHTAKTTPAGGTTRMASVSEPQKNAPAAPTSKVAPAAALRPTGSTKPVTAATGSTTAAATVAQKSVGPERQPGGETGAQHRTSGPAVATAKATSAEDFSVQVGSFGSAEQAERLRTNLAQKGYPVRVQSSAVSGQGLRYRVRVGNFADRTAADQTAHHLTAQEQVPAIVAGKD